MKDLAKLSVINDQIEDIIKECNAMASNYSVINEKVLCMGHTGIKKPGQE